MKRIVNYTLGVLVLAIVACAGIWGYRAISYKMLPVNDGYVGNVDNTPVIRLVALSIGEQIGKAPNGDPIYHINGQPDDDWVYMKQYPAYWYGYGWVTHKKSVKPLDFTKMNVTEIRVLTSGQGSSLLADTKDPKLINDFMSSWRASKIVDVTHWTNSTIIDIQLLSPEIPGLAYEDTVLRNSNHAYLTHFTPTQSLYLELGPAFSEWMNQITSHLSS